MKVFELVELLNAMPQDANVVVVEPYQDNHTEERVPCPVLTYDKDKVEL